MVTSINFIKNITAVNIKPKRVISFGNTEKRDEFVKTVHEESPSPQKLRSSLIEEKIAAKKAKEEEINNDLNMLRARSFDGEGLSPKPDFLQIRTQSTDIRKQIKELERTYTQTRAEELKSDKTMYSYDDFRKEILGNKYKKAATAEKRIPDEMIDRWAKNGYLRRERAGNKEPYYIDSKDERNKETIEILKQKLPHASDFIQFKFRYNLREEKLLTLVAENKITPVLEKNDEIKHSAYFLIDETSEETKNTIRERNKLIPYPSPKFYKQPAIKRDIWVPVNYLTKLGFGDEKTLMNSIYESKSVGKMFAKETPEGRISAMCINIGDTNTENELAYLRATNKSITTPRELAKQLNIKPKDIEEALVNDELEIIKRYVFHADSKKVYINTDTEKNAEFIEKKRLEQELAGEERAAKKQRKGERTSLRMKLIWHYCPKTREIADRLADNEPKIAEITKRRKIDGDKTLNAEENETIRKYFKAMWNESGTREFHDAIKKAKEALRIYDEFGIDAIEDEAIKEIILSGKVI